MQWDFDDDTPIYQQIVNQIKQEIAIGNMKAGDKLPSVRELALDAEVNPNTMQKALAELEREGLVYAKRTAGRFVAEGKEVTKKLQEDLMMEYMKVFLENMKKLGYSNEEVIVLLQQYCKEEKS